MLDHVILDVSDLAVSRAFYCGALAPLGVSVVMEFADRCAFGAVGGKPVFWIAQRGEPARGLHIAVSASDREAVDAFYGAALGLGGIDNGSPGPRPQYHPSYYGAFVLDPDGNNLEAVWHGAAFTGAEPDAAGG